MNDWLARSIPHSLSTVIKPSSINPEFGSGRLFTVVSDGPITIRSAAEKLKRHAGISHVNIALGNDRSLDSAVETVAVCAGSGSSILSGVTADLYITGSWNLFLNLMNSRRFLMSYASRVSLTASPISILTLLPFVSFYR